jgi:predicted small secreted protein
MKKIIIPLLILFLTGSVVLAGCGCNSNPGTETEKQDLALQEMGHGQNETGQENGEGQQVQTGQETENQGEEESLMIQQREYLRARNITELREMIQERQQEMIQEMQTLREQMQEVYQNQNRVRLAVHTLLAMENLTGGIGRNVSVIAREFNNSVQTTIRSEVRIQTRNMFIRILIGGDEQAADEIEQEVNQNQERIQRLRKLLEKCDCPEEVKEMIQEEIRNMEQEQNRLQEMAQNEKKSKGLFGWLFK